VFTISGEQRYAIDKPAWAALLDLAPEQLPNHREWPQLLAVLRTILRWSRQPDLIEASEYLCASAARQLRGSANGVVQRALIGVLAAAGPTVTVADVQHGVEERVGRHVPRLGPGLPVERRAGPHPGYERTATWCFRLIQR
jgi:hypothetical protein